MYQSQGTVEVIFAGKSKHLQGVLESLYHLGDLEGLGHPTNKRTNETKKKKHQENKSKSLQVLPNNVSGNGSHLQNLLR